MKINNINQNITNVIFTSLNKQTKDDCKTME